MINQINPKAFLMILVLLSAMGRTTSAHTIFVDASATGANSGVSWTDAYIYLQDGLMEAASAAKPVEIRMAKGTYTPDRGGGKAIGDRAASFELISGVAVYGGFPSDGGLWESRDPNLYETILSGDLGGNDANVSDPCDLVTEPTRAENSYHVLTGSGTDWTAVLDGFSITAGNANSSTYPDERGGGMFNITGNPTFENCNFKKNSAINYGGAIYNYDSNLVLKDCEFNFNSSANLAGAILNFWGSSPTLTDCRFINNWAEKDGGAINNNNNCDPNITLCFFLDNGAYSGGAIINYNSAPTVIDCNFIGNFAYYGGGIFSWANSSAKLNNCTFEDNWAYYYGAGMYNVDSDPNLIKCDFIENITEPFADTSAKGAGMYNSNSNPILINCSFIRNRADHPGPPPYISCRGGGMYNNNSSPELYGCNFTENFANQYGGGICNVENSYPIVANCIFASNYSDTGYPGGWGGAICSFSSTPSMSHCVFKTNSAYKGGAIYGKINVLANSTFNGNTAYSGGAIYDDAGNPTIVNCQFSGNRATYGGGIYNDTSSPTISNCTFCTNIVTGDGGAIWAIDSILSVSNCILWDNTDTGGTDESAQIHTEGGSLVVNYSCVAGWTGGLGGVGNIGDDPMLVREPNNGGDGWGDVSETVNIDESANDDFGNLHLLPGSPCIDAADNTVVPPDFADLDADDNTTEPTPLDLAGDARFMDDPCTTDTGNGSAPIVDMGAYECPKQGFLLNTESLTIPEGDTATFTVALQLEPAGDFEVAVANESGDPNVLVESGALLVFGPSNYSVPQSVTVRATEDDDHFHGTASIAVTTPRVVTSRVKVTEVDNEPYPNILLVHAEATGANNGSSWEDAFLDLQNALNVCSDLQRESSLVAGYIDFEIWVAGGVYKPAPAFSGDRDASFKLMRHLTLKGGYAGFGEPMPDARDIELQQTILSGDIDGNDVGDLDDPSRDENSYHVVRGSYTDETVVLDGFTITAGNAIRDLGYFGGGGLDNYKGYLTVSNCKFIANSAAAHLGGGGGAVYTSNGHIRITDCDFTGNQAAGNSRTYGGGAVHNQESSSIILGCTFSGNIASQGGAVFNNDSNTTINNCTFSNNAAVGSSGWDGCGGAVSNYNTCVSRITNCTFIQNTADTGGGVYSYGGDGTVIDCTFSNNSAVNGGGMLNAGSVINCTFIGNSAISEELSLGTGNGGAVFNTQGSSAIVNCLFVGNCAVDAYDRYNSGQGGALYNVSSEPVLVNCTVVANTATHSGGGICGSSAKASNCIFWENLDDKGCLQESQIDFSDPNVDYCCIQGWTGSWGGEGNIGIDPNFVDPNGPDGVIGTEDDNLRLSAGSPCIDAADNNSVPLDTMDLDGDGDTGEPIPIDLNGFTRFIDDICTTDTGNGSAPIADMGAYEFLRSDIEGTGFVDFKDYCRLAEYWLESGCGTCNGADLTCDGEVGVEDLQVLAGNWLSGN